MNEWSDERVTLQRELALAGRAGIWMMLEGGPRSGSRGFLPHVDWPFYVMLDAEGASWCFASPPEQLAAPAGARIVGCYTYDREHERMIWHAIDGAWRETPSMRGNRS